MFDRLHGVPLRPAPVRSYPVSGLTAGTAGDVRNPNAVVKAPPHMSSEKPSRRSAVRVFVVVALSLLVVGYSLPDLRRVWAPVGLFGYQDDGDAVIISLQPGLPAQRAGMRVGDHIVAAGTDPVYRFPAIGAAEPATLHPGEQVTIAVVRGSDRRTVTMTSVVDPMTTTEKALIAGRAFAMLLFVGIGAALVLLRPSPATWAFFIFCLGLNNAADMLLPLALSPPWNYIIEGLENVMFMAGLVGVLVFTLLFLHDRVAGWRLFVLRLAPVVLFGLVATAIYGMFAAWYGWPSQRSFNANITVQTAVIVVAMYALVETYALARGSDRQRIRWVVVGFAVALAATAVQGILNNYFNVPYWLFASLGLVAIVVPVTVGYAIIRHRIIDVSFVVSRALVYGILTTILVGVFSLIDWFFTDYLRLARLGTIAEVGAVVAFGLWFNGLHRRVDAFIDATFFRQRHRAEVQLARAAAALPNAPTTETVAYFLIDEPVRALGLASATLFRRTRDGRFERESSHGWEAQQLRALDAADLPLLTLAQTENGPLSLYEHPWREDLLPAGVRKPVLALPIIVRRELVAIAFYGAHEHGEALDPDEVKAIAHLAPGAAAAYDHLEAEALKGLVETLRAQLAEAQIQPA